MPQQDAKPMSQWDSADHTRRAVFMLLTAETWLKRSELSTEQQRIGRNSDLAAAQVHATLALVLKENK